MCALCATRNVVIRRFGFACKTVVRRRALRFCFLAGRVTPKATPTSESQKASPKGRPLSRSVRSCKSTSTCLAPSRRHKQAGKCAEHNTQDAVAAAPQGPVVVTEPLVWTGFVACATLSYSCRPALKTSERGQGPVQGLRGLGFRLTHSHKQAWQVPSRACYSRGLGLSVEI